MKLVQLEQHRLVHAHFAPSCGTASRARERPVPGLPPDRQPRPLRTDDKPDGLSNLSPTEQQRVQSANASYPAAVKLIFILLELGVSVSIENPKNSLFWVTSMMEELYKHEPRGHCTVFHSCMHGGTRDKATKFWSFNPRVPSDNLFDPLGLLCDGNHTHQSWRPKFSMGNGSFQQKKKQRTHICCVCAWPAFSFKRQSLEAWGLTTTCPSNWSMTLLWARGSCLPLSRGNRNCGLPSRNLVILCIWRSQSQMPQ